MNEFSSEKKLELLRQIRDQDERNREILAARESVLYGKPGLINSGGFINDELTAAENKGFSFLKLRFLCAVMLFALTIILDISHMQIAGIGADKIINVISEDFTEYHELNMFDSMLNDLLALL